MKQYLFLCLALMPAMLLAQQTETTPKKKLSKAELVFYAHTVDSITSTLNRMIRFEKQLQQRNYYLNEKSALVDELVNVILSLRDRLEITAIGEADIRKIFGKPAVFAPGALVYSIETYKSNCPFMEITFLMTGKEVQRINYRITDCERLNLKSR